VVLCVAITTLTAAPQSAQTQFSVTPDIKNILDQISPDSLRGHLSFIASDLLEGRNTPSPGLDTAAHYIAAQFRRAGIEAVGDDGYFQTANWMIEKNPTDGLEIVFRLRNQRISVAKDQVSVNANAPVQLARASVAKVNYGDPQPLAGVNARLLKGGVVLTEIPNVRRSDRARRSEMLLLQNEFLSKLKELGVAVVVSIERTKPVAAATPGRLIDPENRPTLRTASSLPVVMVYQPKLTQFYDSMKVGQSAATAKLTLPGQVETPVKLRNVIGVLRGSDPVLKETFIVVSAHYDHIGSRETGESDRIFNGANDDGSGTVSVIELAWALSQLKERPKRSIVFLTYFGEEKGLLGSRYYVRHPVFPLQKTIANINLELMGRTDTGDGQLISSAGVTGFDYSSLGTTLKNAGSLTEIQVFKHPVNSDAFFSRSDNVAFADNGIPAHTISVGYTYPDYHGLGDHWEKIDYANMAGVARMCAVAILMVANSPEEPKWNEDNPRTMRYVQAWKKRRQ
jgi:hypothetical protein